MRKYPLAIAVYAFALCSLPGCSILYKQPTRQGNVIEQKQLDQLQTGMSHDQVRFLMGTPIASDPFRPDRWDYFGYYKSPRGQVSSRTVTLYFDGDKLSRVEGTQVAASDKILDQPDFSTLTSQAKKDKADATRNPNNQKIPSPIDITNP